jgi:hypothetical protein
MLALEARDLSTIGLWVENSVVAWKGHKQTEAKAIKLFEALITFWQNKLELNQALLNRSV